MMYGYNNPAMGMPSMSDGIVMGIPQHSGMLLGEPQDFGQFSPVLQQNQHLLGGHPVQHSNLSNQQQVGSQGKSPEREQVKLQSQNSGQ
jgi:hypothetical protein